ncbi:MAG: type II toxin-antitoxin system HicB family antitoxin [Treponema sp.]|jgi:predicted RNase H-like HicB family nuclease|nr:type II toxin-antitoxin system HicB family antitoxin [Treponema sp.]
MIAKLSMVCSEQSNGSYFAICQEIKGCFTQGDTYEEACANLKELVEITIKEEFKNVVPVTY